MGASKEDVRKGAMEKSWRVGIIERKVVRGDDPTVEVYKLEEPEVEDRA